MKKTILIFTILFTISVPAFSQTTVGFSDPDNIQPLLDYRLPEWGYENLFLDFSLNGLQTTSYQDEDNISDSNFSMQFSPDYSRFRESETRQSSLRAFSNFDYSGESGEDEKSREFQTRINLGATERFYQENSDLFFSGTFSGIFFQNRFRDEETLQGTVIIDESLLNRSFSTTFSIGVGYGRVRNVNPMIRALRLNERFEALNTDQSLSVADVLTASEQFTRQEGYQRSYDRPLKSFWQDMDQLLSPDLSALDPFDLLYLTDTSVETIGQRQEGWEITGTAGIGYSANYIREEDDISGTTSSNLSQFTNFIPRIYGAWYKNLSLEHQISIRSELRYQIPLNRSMDFRTHSFIIGTSWLYNITDRLFTNTSISLISIGQNSDLPSNTNIFAQSDISYFIENSLSLFSSVRFNYRTNSSVTISNGNIISSTDSSQLQFNAGIRYYLLRGIF